MNARDDAQKSRGAMQYISCLFNSRFWQGGHLGASALHLCRIGWPPGHASSPTPFLCRIYVFHSSIMASLIFREITKRYKYI